MGRLIRNKRSGHWVGSYLDSAGKRRRHRLGRDRRVAERTLAALEGQAILDRRLGIRPLKRIRLGGFVERFLDHARKTIRAWKRYATSADQLVAFFGKEADLTAIDPESIEKYKMHRVGGVAGATVNRDLQVLKRMYSLAINWGYARDNPVKRVSFFREPRGRVRYLTRADYEKVLGRAPEHLVPLIVVAVHTGMRLGELLGLKWSDIDFENGYAALYRTKNDVPRRPPLNAHAREALLGIRLKDPTWVFTDGRGRRLSSRTAQWQFKRALEQAGIFDFRFHDLRHTCASWLAMAGENQEVIKEILGHMDIRMTDRYTHLMPGRTKSAVRRLDRFLDRVQKGRLGVSEMGQKTTNG